MADAAELWWANRMGNLAAATTNRYQPQPMFGFAFDAAQTPMTPQQQQELLNAVQTKTEQEAERRQGAEAFAGVSTSGSDEAEDESFWSRVTGAVSDFMAWDPVGDITGKDLEERRGMAGDAIDAGVPDAIQEFDPVGALTGRDLEQRRKDASTVIEYGERGINTLGSTKNIIEEKTRNEAWYDLDNLTLWADTGTWEEAWERADHTTLGQSFSESFMLDPSTRADYHAEGFDDAGMPLDQNYRELREDSTIYNVTSGMVDFAKVWFADPLVIGGKAGSVGRALVKGDLDRMTRSQRGSMHRILSAPDSAIEGIRQQVKPWNVVERRALTMREQMGTLRDRVRTGELDATGLTEEVQAFRREPTAAYMFAEMSGMRKFDDVNQRFLDEYDDEIFYYGVGAMLGSQHAYNKLRVAFDDRGRRVADHLDALRTKTLPSLDEEAALAQQRFEEALTDPNLDKLDAYERAYTAQQDFQAARHRGEMVKEQISEYDSYGRFVNALDDRVAQAGISMVPRSSRSIGDAITDTAVHTYRPSGAAGNTATYIKYPMSAFRERPGVMDLHREIHTQSSRLLDEAVAIAKESAPEGWNEMRQAMLNKAAAASNDVERRAVAGQVEDVSIELVARKHGLTPEEARGIATAYKGHRGKLFRDMESQHKESQAYNAGQDSFTYKWSEDGELKEMEVPVELMDMPITETQLGNYFIPMDLKAFDELLSRHSESIKALAKTKNFVDEVGQYFNAFWKPMVLFRVGYIARNLSDEGLRAVAALDTLASALVDMPKAAAIGAANLPLRAINRINYGYNRAQRRAWQKRVKQEEQDGGPMVQGTLDAVRPNEKRQSKILDEVQDVESWNQKRLHNLANGRSEPKAPKFVNRVRAAMESGEDVAIDMATGRRMKSTDSVMEIDLGNPQILLGQPEDQLARFVQTHADLLSHEDGVLLLRREGDGWRAGVGRRGAKHVNDVKLIDQMGTKAKYTVRGEDGVDRQYGIKLRSKAGDEHHITAPFQEGIAENYRALNSSAPYYRTMTSSYEGNLARLREDAASGVRSTIGDTNHAASWLHVIDNQLRQSPVVRARLEGQELSDWLKTEAGRSTRERMKWRSKNPYKWQTELDNHLNTLLPTERLRAIVREDQPLTEQDLQQIIDARREVAPKAIDSVSVDGTLGQRIGARLESLKDKIYHAIATVPTDTLIRNPFFARMYKSRMQDAIDTLAPGEVVSLQAQKVMERQAREYALKQTRRYMFSLMDETALSHSTRGIMAFMGAWQETLQRWGRIISERPEQFARLYVNGWQQMDKLPGVEFVDENGLSSSDEGHGELSYIRMPWLDDAMRLSDPLLPGDQSAAADSFATFNISKEGLNTVMQGNPWWLPGVNPLVTYPAGRYFKDKPHLADDNAFSSFMYKYLFPTGVPDAMDVALPASWMQQARRAYLGTEDATFTRMMADRVHQQEMQDWIDSGRQGPRPDPRESTEKAEAAQAFMAAARFMSPASFNPEVKSQFFIDAANRIGTEHGFGEEGMQKFLEEYGDDAWIWWQSTSQSNTGVPATSEGFLAQQKYREQIEKYPELGLALVGFDTELDEFNYQVYDWQGKTPVSNVDPTKQRSALSPDDVVASAEEREGWRRWNWWGNKIDAELSARGLHSTQQAGAEDLALIKRNVADSLMEELPGWADSYTSFDTDKTYGVVRSMAEIVENDMAPQRADWAGVADYLDIHRRVGAELDARGLAGGSRDITAQQNQDLLAAWNYMVGGLVQSNIAFADIYHRYLERHSLTMGSGRVD